VWWWWKKKKKKKKQRPWVGGLWHDGVECVCSRCTSGGRLAAKVPLERGGGGGEDDDDDDEEEKKKKKKKNKIVVVVSRGETEAE